MRSEGLFLSKVYIRLVEVCAHSNPFINCSFVLVSESITDRERGANDLDTESEHQHGQAVEADVEREWRNAHDCSNHEDLI